MGDDRSSMIKLRLELKQFREKEKVDKDNELIEPEKKKAPKHQRPESLLADICAEGDAAGDADMI